MRGTRLLLTSGLYQVLGALSVLMRTQVDLFFLAQTLKSRRVSLFKDPDSPRSVLPARPRVKNGNPG
jgi:hypothetical protein